MDFISLSLACVARVGRGGTSVRLKEHAERLRGRGSIIVSTPPTPHKFIIIGSTCVADPSKLDCTVYSLTRANTSHRTDVTEHEMDGGRTALVSDLFNSGFIYFEIR